MKKRIGIFFAIIFAGLFLAGGLAFAEKKSGGEPQPDTTLFSKQSAYEEYELLGSRISIKMPKGSTYQSSQTSIMAAERSKLDEVWLSSQEIADSHISVYARELYALSTGDLLQDAQSVWKILGKRYSNSTFSPVITSGTAQSIRIFFDPLPNEKSGLIGAAVTRTADSTLVFIGIYASGTALPDSSELAGFLISTIKGESRKLISPTHVERIENMDIQIQRNCVLTKQQGIDFSVYAIKKIVPFGQNSPHMGIYFGGFSNFSAIDAKLKSEGLQEKTGTILGKEVKWRLYGQDENSAFFAQTLVDLGREQMHIFINLANTNDFIEMKEMAESLLLVNNDGINFQ